jgi:hypothetical protein
VVDTAVVKIFGICVTVLFKRGTTILFNCLFLPFEDTFPTIPVPFVVRLPVKERFSEVGTETIFFRLDTVTELGNSVVFVLGISVVVSKEEFPAAVEFSLVYKVVTIPTLESVVATNEMLGFSIIPFSCS